MYGSNDALLSGRRATEFHPKASYASDLLQLNEETRRLVVCRMEAAAFASYIFCINSN